VYIPPHFKQDTPDLARWLIRTYSFATMITPSAEGLKVTHLPCLIDSDRGKNGVIRAHVAKSNDHWRVLEGGNETIIIFQGPHAYVSPTWYQNQVSVPTWNYATVHVYGKPVLLDSEPSYHLLIDMLHTFERPESEYDYRANAEYIRKLLPAIVAFEIPVARTEAKFKLSQNKPESDRISVIEHLGEGDELSRQVARLMIQGSGNRDWSSKDRV